jgi:hypothetical protein
MLTTEPGTAKADPEVLAIARRRQFSAEFKRNFLREYEASPKGERGSLLTRGLVLSHDAWRKQCRRVSRDWPKNEGAATGAETRRAENQRLVRQIARLEHQPSAHGRSSKCKNIRAEWSRTSDELKDDAS